MLVVISNSQLQAEHSLHQICNVFGDLGDTGRFCIMAVICKETHKAGFFELDIIILTRYLIVVGAVLCIISKFSSIPGLYSVDASRDPSASVVASTNVLTLTK